jgi:hypothetical protein
MDEVTEMRSFHNYYEQNKGKMDAISLEASWLALKGVCSVKPIPNGVRIDKVTDKYSVYMAILERYNQVYKLSTEERAQQWTELVKYARIKLGQLSAN